MRTAYPHFANYDRGGIPGGDRTHVCTSPQPRKLPPGYGDRPIANKRLQKNQALLWWCTAIDGEIKKQIVMAVQKVFSIWVSNGPRYAATSLQVIRDDWQNLPWRKCSQDDGDIWPRRTPRPPHRPSKKGEGIFKGGKADNFQCHDGVKRDHPSGRNGNIQWGHQGVAAKKKPNSRRGHTSRCFSHNTPRAKKIVNHHRERGIYFSSTNI